MSLEISRSSAEKGSEKKCDIHKMSRSAVKFYPLTRYGSSTHECTTSVVTGTRSCTNGTFQYSTRDGGGTYETPPLDEDLLTPNGCW